MDILVIGYGNELRGDDAIGLHLASRVEEWRLPGVRTRIVRQLTPELAQDLAFAKFALFIDASVSGGESGLHWQLLQPAEEAGSFAHIGHPGVLLALTQSIYQIRPEAWLLTITADSFDFGAPLSSRVQAALPSALQQMRDMILQWQKAL